MKDDVKDFLTAKGVPWQEVDDLHEVGGARASTSTSATTRHTHSLSTP
jgi:hypothetical protein